MAVSPASVYPSRAAEKVVFNEQFESPAKVHRNGGVLTGDPLIRDGIYLNGITQYGTWAIPARLLAHNEISFETRFTPESNPDDGTSYYLYDSSGGSRYYVNKYSDNKLYISFGNTGWTSILLATYAPYWITGRLNIIVASGTGGSNKAWLNGHLILSDSVAWTPANPTALWIGANFGGGSPFKGVIHSLKIRSRLLTQLDVDAIQSNSLFTYI